MREPQATEVVRVDPDHPAADAIARAAQLIRCGRLVAFPTETVYGLGANALDAAAVRAIFTAKGRPPTNPVIVHVNDAGGAATLVRQWPPLAEQLAARFWPGSLTLVLRKRAEVPDVVTAGGPTVAVRAPAHPVARALIAAAGVPIAAPSANPSSRISPTQAEHVLQGLAGKIDLILDGGATPGGLESTVLDLTVAPPRLLRPGLISPAEIESVIGPIERPSHATGKVDLVQGAKSPGQLRRHYSPSVPIECAADDGRSRVLELLNSGYNVGWLAIDPAETIPGVTTHVLPNDAISYSARLYAALFELERAGVDCIVAALPPESDEWFAVRDRLRRAAG